MAATKSRRSNAGNLMQKLIEDEVDDDFYKSTYGGFDEEECDNDYESEEEVDDVVDSDFSIEEQDDEKSDDEDDRPKKRKKMVVKTFKTPKAKTETAPKNDGVKKAKVTKPKQESSPVKMVKMIQGTIPNSLISLSYLEALLKPGFHIIARITQICDLCLLPLTQRLQRSSWR